MDARDRSKREPQSLEAWDTWIDKLIVEAQERGDFDNLPGQGKPLHIEETPFTDGRELGFGILKNAGFAPYWVELEKEIRTTSEQLDDLLARAAALARERQTRRQDEEPIPEVSLRWWWPFGRRKERLRAEPAPAVDLVTSEIARLRRVYLEQAAERERLIGQYNAAIPRDLWHLERPLTTREAAEQTFDQAVAAGSQGSNE
jgi:hypothetical protein